MLMRTEDILGDQMEVSSPEEDIVGVLQQNGEIPEKQTMEVLDYLRVNLPEAEFKRSLTSEFAQKLKKHYMGCFNYTNTSGEYLGNV